MEGNSAGLLGGAIATSNTNVVIKTSVFVDNYSGSLGGALSFFAIEPGDVGWTEDDEVKTLLIDQTTFGEDVPEGCAASDISDDPENEAASNGGAADIAGGDVTIRRSSFIGNKSGTDAARSTRLRGNSCLKTTQFRATPPMPMAAACTL